MPFLFSVIYILLLICTYTIALLKAKRYEVKPDKQHRPSTEPKAPPKAIEGANCITWNAQTGEVLEEKVL